MRVILRIAGAAGGQRTEFDNRYVMAYDPSVGIHGAIDVTLDPAKALAFPGIEEAWRAWTEQSKSHPLRPDGKPNRPLTAFTVEFVKLP